MHRTLDATIFGIEANTEAGVQTRRRPERRERSRGGEIPGTRETARGVEAGPTEKWRRRALRREAEDRSVAVVMASDPMDPGVGGTSLGFWEGEMGMLRVWGLCGTGVAVWTTHEDDNDE